MSAYLIDDGVAVGVHKFRCSNCGDNIRLDGSASKLRFCWHCSMQFGPEPKPEPTGGDWRYEERSAVITSKNGTALIADVSGFTHDTSRESEQRANGYLLAASKKLLAACIRLVQFNAGYPDITADARAAIAAATPPKQ